MNYKKLRSSLRKPFIEQLARFEIIDARIKRLLAKEVTDKQRRALMALVTSLEDLEGNARATIEASIERSVLIEKQIDRKEFEGELHEDYHRKSKQLRTGYHI